MSRARTAALGHLSIMFFIREKMLYLSRNVKTICHEICSSMSVQFFVMLRDILS